LPSRRSPFAASERRAPEEAVELPASARGERLPILAASPFPLSLSRMADPDEKGQQFLRALQGPGTIAQPVCVVLAHPDDETIGLGAQLPRLTDLVLVLVTDGAPRSGDDAKRAGFDTPEEYARTRSRELRQVLRTVGLAEERLVRFDVPDQEAALRMVEIAKGLARLFRQRRPEIVVTHAYEGGHPDHDATAFAVRMACRMVSEAECPGLVEVPLYRLGPEGREPQQFTPLPRHPELALALDAEQRALKQRLFGAHASQREVLSWFSTDIERFRLAPDYDFAALPNGGRLLYEQFEWGMTGARWQALVRDASVELAGPRAA
jgi:LmbE family N-acetylglucosaminyl deacetylase